ncbi:hypothetical protein CF134_14820 [Aeromonas salmonicida]|nr:hypothetical protein K931_08202 [Aeromonas salmonicida subsp. pectinolytica 34mel]TNI15184.1 hypothetical protein CF134_14820 [Aeromonas salmonicida]
MNIFLIQDGAVDPHFKGEKFLGSANGDFYANAPDALHSSQTKTRRSGFGEQEAGAHSMQWLTRTQFRG